MSDRVDDQEKMLIDAIFALGKNFFKQGKYEKARIIFDGLMSISPTDLRSAIYYGETLVMEGQHQCALDHFLFLQKKFEADERFILGAAKASILLNRFQEAQNILRPIVEGDVDSSIRSKATAIAMGAFNLEKFY